MDIINEIKTKGYANMGIFAIESVFETFGYKCIAVIYNDGHRCGYVGIPKGYRYYGKKYDSIPISCHGGLSFGRSHYPLDDGMYYIGFDFAHFMDKYDTRRAREIWKDDKDVMDLLPTYDMYNKAKPTATTPTVEDVERELRYIIEQLKESIC